MGLIALATVGGVVALWAMVSFNRFVAQRQVIDNSWANVETELRRRHDLIPNLVATVRGYADHEAEALHEVVEARNAAAATAGGPAAHEGTELALSSGLRHLFAVSEAYPELLASEQFLELQRELVTTEDRLQAARRLFNGNIREYNRRVESIPSLFIAKLARCTRRDYFEVESSAAAAPSFRNTD